MATSTNNMNRNYLTGKLLIATPLISNESLFNKSVIYIVTHNDTGAIGLVINHPINNVNCSVIFNSFNIEPTASDVNKMPIYFGGPVEAERGFILHTNDYSKEPIFKLDTEVSLSSSLQILKDIADGNGPTNSIFALGYAGWQEGQLEEEIANNNWLTIPFSKEIVFAKNNAIKWELAMNSIGIHPFSFSGEVGHA